MSGHRDLQKRLARLPSVQLMLNHPRVSPLSRDYPRPRVVEMARAVIDEARRLIGDAAGTASNIDALDPDILATRLVERLSGRDPAWVRPVINVTGVLFHPDAGPSPVSDAVLRIMEESLTHPVPEAESDAVRLLCELTGVEDALMAHTGGGALFLAMQTFGQGREVIVSRSQLGLREDGTRLLALLHRGGARVIEVGATNKTHLSDYRRVITGNTGAILVVRPTTYALQGFTEEPSLATIAGLGRESGVPVIHEIGHATLRPAPGALWTPPVSVVESARAGVDVTLFRSDRLIGGPEAGIAVGESAATGAMRQNPIYSVTRPTQTVLAGLSETLRFLALNRFDFDHHPAAWMLTATAEQVYSRAEKLYGLLKPLIPDKHALSIEAAPSFLTLYRLPDETLPGYALVYSPSTGTVEEAQTRLAAASPALLTTVTPEGLEFHLRTCPDHQIETIFRILKSELKNACANSLSSVY